MSVFRMKIILLSTLATMSLHTIEEYVSNLWNQDPFIIWLAQNLNISSINIYLIIQAIALLLITASLILTIKRRFNLILGVILGFIFFLELLHPFNSIKILGYYPGLYTGIILIIIGFFYWKELLAMTAYQHRQHGSNNL